MVIVREPAPPDQIQIAAKYFALIKFYVITLEPIKFAVHTHREYSASTQITAIRSAFNISQLVRVFSARATRIYLLLSVSVKCFMFCTWCICWGNSNDQTNYNDYVDGFSLVLHTKHENCQMIFICSSSIRSCSPFALFLYLLYI